MSSSIAIPQRKGAQKAAESPSPSPSGSSSPPYSILPQSPSADSSSSSSPSSGTSARRYHDRRPSLLSSSISKSEHTVINVGHPDGPPRLITCVKSSQGFDWNQEIFLPSYMGNDSTNLERKQDPVEDIVLTDEEVASMFPQ